MYGTLLSSSFYVNRHLDYYFYRLIITINNFNLECFILFAFGFQISATGNRVSKQHPGESRRSRSNGDQGGKLFTSGCTFFIYLLLSGHYDRYATLSYRYSSGETLWN